MSQEKIKEILIDLIDSDSNPNRKRERFLQALSEINKIVMDCVPKEAVVNSDSAFLIGRKKGYKEAIAEFKAKWEE